MTSRNLAFSYLIFTNQNEVNFGGISVYCSPSTPGAVFRKILILRIFLRIVVLLRKILTTGNPLLDLYTEEGELSEDQDQPVTDPDQPVSEEQNYRDTMRGIRSFMGWSHIPEMDSTASTSDDNPFAGPKTVTPSKVSVKMPTEDWLCRKLAKLNLTLVEGYSSCGSEAGGLAKDVFLRLARTKSKWYGLYTNPKAESSDFILEYRCFKTQQQLWSDS